MRPGYARLHFFKDRDGDLPVGEAWGLLFDRDEGFRRDPEDGKPQETATDKVRDALAALEAESWLTVKELASITGYAVNTVRGALRELPTEDRDGPHGEKAYRLREDPDAQEGLFE